MSFKSLFFTSLLHLSFLIHSLCSTISQTTLPCQITDNVCQITSLVQNFTSINLINSTLTVNIQDSILTCQDFTSTSCQFLLNTSAITLTNTTIYFPDIHLESSTISFLGSNILSNGTQIGGSGSPATPNIGVAYAGQGSSCDGSSDDFSYGDYNIQYTASTAFGSGSTLDTANSKGGGRIVIISYQDLSMTNASINASGFGNCSNKQIAVNGGSGGYVWLEHKALATAKEQITSSTIDISGGSGCQGVSEPDPIEKRVLLDKKTVQTGLGGSGGRAIIYLQKIDSINVITSGGIGKNAKVDSCVNGAAGTLYSLKDDILIVKNSNITTSAPTMLASQVVNLSTLKVLESGLVSFKKADFIEFYAGGVTLTKGSIVYSNPSSSVLLKIIDIQVIQESKIAISGGGEFNLLACHFLVDTGSLIISPNALLSLLDQQQCNTPTFVISGDIVSNVTTMSPREESKDDVLGIATTLIIYFPVSAANFQLEGAIHYDNAYLFANGIGTFALNLLRISSDYRTCLQETAPPLINPLLIDANLTKNTTLNLTQFVSSLTGDPSFSFTNLRNLVNNAIRPIYTVFFFIEDNLQFESTVITAARVGIFSKTLSLDSKSTVSTTGKGCSAGLGNGLTNSDLANFCPGSGGSYGGLGGPGISELNNTNFQFICNSLVGNTYRQEGLPTLEGSGGGGSSDQYLGGKGGGLVVIGMKQGTIDGTIDCNGYIGMIPDDSKTGSGSGGSIQIHTLRRLGGKGTVRAEGGPQTNLGGGFGGGGRIYVNYIGWKEMMSDPVNLEAGGLTFSAKCGDSSGGIPTLVHHGSVGFRPCLPGFYGPTCLPCQKGTFKADFGNSECQACEDIEGYSNFNKTGETNYLCDFECEDGLVAKSLNPHCLSNFSYYATYVGGIYGVLGLSTLFLVLIVFILKKIVFQEKTLKKIVRNASNKHLNIARMTSRELTISPKAPARMKRASFHSYEPWRVLSQEENFLIEDLPYLKHRLYLKGSNTPYNPWYLSEEPPREIHKLIDKEAYSQFCKDVNDMCVYSRKWILLLDLLLVVYAPFYLTLLRFLQKRVVGKVRKFLKESDYNFWSVNKCRIFPFSMKLSTSQNFMLGSVEVLDYKKDFDEWDARDLFPVSLALGGRASFYHPLQINLADPLVSGLQLNFHEVFSAADYQQDHLEINLDRDEESLEKESIKFLLEFNKLTRQVDFGAFKEWFIDQTLKVIQYVDKKNKTLFKQLDIQVLLYVEISARPGHNLPLKLRDTGEVKPQGSILDRSKSIIYHLSQESLDFSIEDLKKIHHIYHHDSSISMQFYLKFQYIHHENRINLLQLTKKKTQPVNNRAHVESVFNEIEVDIGQLKEHLFERLEKQGENPNTIDSMRDVNDEASEAFTRDKEIVPCPKSCGSQGKRILKMLRYLILGYRQWIIQKYILIVVLLLLVVIDLILIILMMIHYIPFVLLNIPFPLVAFAMPVAGIFWILGSSSISMGKALLTMNVMAFVNIGQAIVNSNGPNELALVALLLVKTLIVPFGCQYVSYLNNIRDTVD